MRKWPKRVGFGLAVVLALGAPSYWWLLVESAAPDGRAALDLAEVRRLAASVPGERAREVRVERVGAFSFPATAVVAGDGWAATSMDVYAYQLVLPGGHVVVDTAMDETTAKAGFATSFDAAAFARLGAALTTASLIVVTHEHFDHLAGLATHPQVKALLPRAKLTKEQLADARPLEPAAFPAGALEGYAPLEYQGAAAVAPGVVLVKAPGHTPGSQLVYVQRADGAEYLFLGDVAWSRRNVEARRERARLATLLIREDRTAVLRQLAALDELRQAEPALHLVPGHDKAAVDALVRAGLLVERFAQPE